MIVWGWSGMSHDASLAVFNKSRDRLELLFAGHSERYSRIKNDKNLNAGIVGEALQYGEPAKAYFYETPWLKKTRQAYAGQYNLLKKPTPRSRLAAYGVDVPHIYTRHHHSHAAAGYYTSVCNILLKF